MSLILSSAKLYTGRQAPTNAFPIRITIPKSSLSIPYELREGSKITGSIVQVYESLSLGGLSQITDIPKLDVEFILTSAGSELDSLYITNDSWKHLRDYGILPDKNWICVDLQVATTTNNTKIEIYPKKNVTL